VGADAGELGGVAVHEFIEAFRFIAHNGAVPGAPTALPSLTHLTLETLKVAAIGLAIAIALAIPLGVWLGHLHRGSFVAINVGNIGRALPSLVVLAIGDAFFGLGLTVVELALVILAVPPIVTNAYLAVDGVDADLVDAAKGMGMSGLEILRGVELPLAVPLLFAGVRTAAVFVVSTTTIAALAGFSGSLGDVIANETSYRFSGVLGAAICVAALALVVDGALAIVQRAFTPRALRSGGRELSVDAEHAATVV
jgi:osmoprotectant transport system permease protein